jgi:hypothetical protein
MMNSKSRVTFFTLGLVAVLSACTTLDPYTREERPARAQRQAIIGAAAVPSPV